MAEKVLTIPLQDALNIEMNEREMHVHATANTDAGGEEVNPQDNGCQHEGDCTIGKFLEFNLIQSIKKFQLCDPNIHLT